MSSAAKSLAWDLEEEVDEIAASLASGAFDEETEDTVEECSRVLLDALPCRGKAGSYTLRHI